MVSQELLRRRILLLLTPLLEKSEIHEGGRQRIWSRCYSRPSEDPGSFFPFFFSQIFKQAFQSNCVVSYSGTAFFLASTGK
jgi:hypothetical protein